LPGGAQPLDPEIDFHFTSPVVSSTSVTRPPSTPTALAKGAHTCQQLVQASILGGIPREDGALGLGPSFQRRGGDERARRPVGHAPSRRCTPALVQRLLPILQADSSDESEIGNFSSEEDVGRQEDVKRARPSSSASRTPTSKPPKPSRGASSRAGAAQLPGYLAHKKPPPESVSCGTATATGGTG